MGLSLFKSSGQEDNNSEKSEKTLQEELSGTFTEELIIGLCGPIGTDIHLISRSLKQILEDTYSYKVEIIRLSDFIKQKTDFDDNSFTTRFEEIEALINYGNDLRKKFDKSILAEFAINQIAYLREISKKNNEFESNRVCYIIDSLKNEQELRLFREIYSDLFYFIGVFSSEEVRRNNLKKDHIEVEHIQSLIERDYDEKIDNGQNVKDTFVEADFFLRIEDQSSIVIEPRIKRILSLIFASEILTPTDHENAMYLAHSAAGNSACLSRQVGACITDKLGEVISVGWNDVPKAGGGLYQFDPLDVSHKNDKRCLYFEDDGTCINDKEKSEIVNEIVSELHKENLIDKEKLNDITKIIEGSRIKSIIEFSRAIHAEMHAIINGCQIAGKRIIEGRLYVTTYPCHNCAKHIVASGIKEVFYIEPYSKSKASRLHSDSIIEQEGISGKVLFHVYEGVAPRRYLDLYRMKPDSRKRKDGKRILVDLKIITPKKTLSLQAIPILEGKVTKDLKTKQLI